MLLAVGAFITAMGLEIAVIFGDTLWKWGGAILIGLPGAAAILLIPFAIGYRRGSGAARRANGAALAAFAEAPEHAA